MHEISIQNGIAEAMYAVEPAWHGLGQVVSEAPNSEDALRIAHLDWQVLQRPLFMPTVAPDVEDPTESEWGKEILAGRFAGVGGKVVNVRSDSGAPLGVVSTQYKPVQNADAFKFVDGLVQDGIVKYESAGALRGGKFVWLLARMPGRQDTVAEGDQLERYILFMTAHDGSRAATIMPTSVRVVCWNTLTLALGQELYRQYKVTHSGDVNRQLDEARKVLGLADQKFERYAERAAALAAVKIDREAFWTYLDEVMPLPLEGSPKLRERIRNQVADLYANAPAQTLKSIKGTAWAAYNSVTHYVDHAVLGGGGAKANRLYSIWLDHGASVKTKALKAAVKMFVPALAGGGEAEEAEAEES